MNQQPPQGPPPGWDPNHPAWGAPPPGWAPPPQVVIVEHRGPNRLVRLSLLAVLGFVVACGAYWAVSTFTCQYMCG